MTPRWTPLALTYLGTSIVGLVVTWTFNIIAITQQSTFFGEWFSNGAASQSLQWDLVFVVAAASILMIVEGRRVGMRRAWLFIPLAMVTAAAFAVPLFLALRERRLSARDAETRG